MRTTILYWGINVLLMLQQSYSSAQIIATGGAHSVVLCKDSVLWTWGGNGGGQLGDSTNLMRSSPIKVHGYNNTGFFSDVISIGAGEGFSFGIKRDSTLWAWGINTYGVLGDSSSVARFTPVPVHGQNNMGYLTNVRQVVGGKWHSLALKHDSTVWTWGSNLSGQLGDSSTNGSLVPIKAKKISSAIAIDAGEQHSLALKNDGSIWAWGMNTDGELGNGMSGGLDSVPSQVHGLGNSGFIGGIIAISAGYYHNLALKNDGTVWAWGNNTWGELGNGAYAVSGCFCSTSPVQVIGLSGVIAIEAGNGYSIALKNDSTVWAWGINNEGELGDGTKTKSNIPVQVRGTGNMGFLSGITEISSKFAHTLALRQDGTIISWGYNSTGQLGNGLVNISGCMCDSIPVFVSGSPCGGSNEIFNFDVLAAKTIVYPNPTQNDVNIVFPESIQSADIKVKLRNFIGEELYVEISSQSDKAHIDARTLNSGIYFIEITTNICRYIKKISKE